ncbi:MAG TPA: hypothetical protein VJV04_02495 [Nitrospiraceae bacterium]|nr:hypothetical protein [Nitrospiraceae bacterium]
MRERRWETQGKLDFNQVLRVGERLAGLGLKPASPAKDIIAYIEEWAVETPDELDKLDPWSIEDITLVQVRDAWQGDFFLLAGAFHTVYQRYQEVGTYCSISHPWNITMPLRTILPRAMFWLGFRHTHAFIRVRLHTADVITPGETRADDERSLWLEDRQSAFHEAIALLDVPLKSHIINDQVVIVPEDSRAPLFCSWPDAFGPSQFEYNSSDAFEFLVPASRLASTHEEPTTVRAYLTGFSEEALKDFQAVEPGSRSVYRCSVHCPLDEVPEILSTIAPTGRLYATLCEFHTQDMLADRDDASAIIGIVGIDGAFQLEVRLNRAPLPEDEMAPWLKQLLGLPVTVAPLPPFP